MPPRPRSPKARTGTTRRPRVAGLTSVTQRPDTGSDNAGSDNAGSDNAGSNNTGSGNGSGAGPEVAGRRKSVRPAAFADDPLAEPTEAPGTLAPERTGPERTSTDAPADRPEAHDSADRDDMSEDRDEEPAPSRAASPTADVVDRSATDAPPELLERYRSAAVEAPVAEPVPVPEPVRPTPHRRPGPSPAPADFLADSFLADSEESTPTEAIPLLGPSALGPSALDSTVLDPTALDTAVLDLRALRTEPANADRDAEPVPTPVTVAPPHAMRAALLRPVPLLAGAFVLLIVAAVTFGLLDAGLRNTPTASNAALVDVAGTAEAAGQLSDALETVYSFDFTRLDENERAARDVITPAFAAEFDRLFADVRRGAPEQQAVVSATVTLSAVKELSEDRAVLVAFVDQQATRAAPDAESRRLAAAGRLTVIGEQVDGRWKIAAVVPR